jgi:hypothetical protein
MKGDDDFELKFEFEILHAGSASCRAVVFPQKGTKGDTLVFSGVQINKRVRHSNNQSFVSSRALDF